MGDNSDAFFNSFDMNVPPSSRQQGGSSSSLLSRQQPRPPVGTSGGGGGAMNTVSRPQPPPAVVAAPPVRGPPPPGGAGGMTRVQPPPPPPRPSAPVVVANGLVPPQQTTTPTATTNSSSTNPKNVGTGSSLRKTNPLLQQQKQQQQTQPQFSNPSSLSQQPTYYGQQPNTYQPQQQSNPMQVSTAGSINNDTLGSDWYTPTQQNQQQQPPFHHQPMPSAMPAVGMQFTGQQQQQQGVQVAVDTNQVYGSNQYGAYPNQQQQQQQQQPNFVPQPHVLNPVSTTPSYLEGSMDTSGHSRGSHTSSSVGGMNNSMFLPQPTMIPMSTSSDLLMAGAMMMSNGSTPTPPGGVGGVGGGYNDLDDYSNEPPLLEELGVNVEHIIMKTKAVVVPFRRFSKGSNSALVDPTLIMDDADLAGPLAFALLLGGELLLAGKLQFGYIYGFGMFGCLSMTLILNLMSPDKAVSFWTVTSILGYALLPVNLLAAIKLILVNLAGFLTLTRVLALLTVLWSTTASTRLLEVGCGMEAQRYLLAYPIALLYSAFVLITIF